jgi:hypothetical protein
VKLDAWAVGIIAGPREEKASNKRQQHNNNNNNNNNSNNMFLSEHGVMTCLINSEEYSD